MLMATQATQLNQYQLQTQQVLYSVKYQRAEKTAAVMLNACTHISPSGGHINMHVTFTPYRWHMSVFGNLANTQKRFDFMNSLEKKNLCGLARTWVTRVLLIETVDSAEHKVEDHLAVWIVHTRG